MNRTLPLFEAMERVWIEPLWRSLGPETHQEIVWIRCWCGRSSR